MRHRRLRASTRVVTMVLLCVLVMAAGLRSTNTSASSWLKEQVDEGAEYVSLAFDNSDIPHVTYAWWGEVKVAHRAGGVWQVATLGPGDHPSLALAEDGRPQVVYYDWESDDLKYASWTGQAWSMEVIESTENALVYTSLALDSLGRPHVSYADRELGTLNYAKIGASDWVTDVIDTGMPSSFEHSSIALDASDAPHVAYYRGGDLHYASLTGEVWSDVIVDSDGTTGAFCSLAFDSQDAPHISYQSQTDYHFTVRHATRPGISWEIEEVGGGMYSSLALDEGDHPHVVYWGDSQTKCSWHDGTRWNVETVGETGMASGENWRFSIATNSHGRPSVAYWGDGISFTYATREATPATSEILESSGGEVTGADGATLVFPNGCLTDTAVITYTPRSVFVTGELVNTDYAFDLTAVYSDTGLAAQVVPGQSYTTTIPYSDLGPVIENESLGLYWWDAEDAHWSQDGVTSTVNITDNLVTAQVSHFSVFALLGETRRVFLPLVIRGY